MGDVPTEVDDRLLDDRAAGDRAADGLAGDDLAGDGFQDWDAPVESADHLVCPAVGECLDWAALAECPGRACRGWGEPAECPD